MKRGFGTASASATPMSSAKDVDVGAVVAADTVADFSSLSCGRKCCVSVE